MGYARRPAQLLLQYNSPAPPPPIPLQSKTRLWSRPMSPCMTWRSTLHGSSTLRLCRCNILLTVYDTGPLDAKSCQHVQALPHAPSKTARCCRSATMQLQHTAAKDMHRRNDASAAPSPGSHKPHHPCCTLHTNTEAPQPGSQMHRIQGLVSRDSMPGAYKRAMLSVRQPRQLPRGHMPQPNEGTLLKMAMALDRQTYAYNIAPRVTIPRLVKLDPGGK